MWSTARAPFQREIMDVITEPLVERVSVESSSQIGKTEIILNAIGFFVDQDPSPQLIVQPTLEMGEAFSKDRLAPMITACPALAGKVSTAKGRESGNTIRHKRFPGGHITISGANSPASLAMRPVRIVAPDEVDRYGESAGTEGDPVDLAWKRAATFHNRKLIMTSTPGYADLSRIDRAFKAGDRRRFHVPCPHCGEYQVLQFVNLKWVEHDPRTAHFVCTACARDIDESDKPLMLAQGVWIAEGQFNGHASFHIWEAYSPWRRWQQIVAAFYEAKGNPETLKVWTNTCLGEPWEDRHTSITVNADSRGEPYDAEVPTGALMITAGVDTQDNRLEVSIWGWGTGEEPFAIDHVVLPGDTSRDEVWAQLDKLLFDREFEWAYGGTLRIAGACVDSGGHRAQAVYRYVEPRQVRHVYATKGMAGEGYPVISYPTRKRTAESRIPVRLHIIGTDTAKSTIYHRLATPPGESGAMHFPNRYPFEAGYFDQLTAEKCVTEYRAGVGKRVWKKKPGMYRNEALDCAVLALAALHKLRPNWRRLELMAQRRVAESGQVETSDPGLQLRPAAPEKSSSRPKVRRRGGFRVDGWKT